MFVKSPLVFRFNWTDGKLNSSNLIELSGQITEKFDEEFRVLYAQSLPVNTRGPPCVRNSSIYEHLIRNPVPSSPLRARERPVEPVCLTSTPSRKPQTLALQPPSTLDQKTSPASDSSTIGDDWTEQQHMQEEILAGSATQRFPGGQLTENEQRIPSVVSCHASTQTSRSVTDSDAQTDLLLSQHLSLVTLTSTGPNQTPVAQAASVDTLKDCFHKLSKERQHHYTNIRAKLEHIVTALSHRRELADVTNTAQGLGAHSRQRPHQGREQEPNPRLLVESAGMGTWPRARCVH